MLKPLIKKLTTLCRHNVLQITWACCRRKLQKANLSLYQ